MAGRFQGGTMGKLVTKFTSILLSISMVFSICGVNYMLPGNASTAYADDNSAAQVTGLQAGTLAVEEGTKAAGDTHYIAVASDRHGTSSAIANAMGGMPSSVEYVNLDGDMVSNGSYNTSTLQAEVRSDAGLSEATVQVMYASHDSSVNDDAGILQCRNSSGLIYTGYNADGSIAYYVYGVSYSSMTSSSSNDAAAFESWVDGADPSIPVIVICHVPLHAQRNDNGGAVAWNKALNYAATGEETTSSGKEVIRNVIFLHGHNHTTESNREYYIPVDSTMRIYSSSNSSYIYYTYTTAGYLNANTAATLIAIDDSNITISKYKSGSVTSTYSSDVSFSDNYDTAATHTIERVGGAAATLEAEDVEVKPAADGTVEPHQITYTFTVEGQIVTPTTVSYTVKSDTSGIINNISNTGLITFNSNKYGSATVTINWTYVSGSKAAGDTYNGSRDITVTVRDSGSGGKEVYVLKTTDHFTLGCDYLIANGNSGTVTLLGQSGGSQTRTTADVVTEGGYTYIETAKEAYIWNATAHPNSSYATYPRLINNETYAVYPNQGNIGFSNSLTATSGAVYTRYWDYADGALAGISTNSNSTTYYMTYSSNAFALATAAPSNAIYIFEKQTIKTEVNYGFTADDVMVRANEDGTVNSKTVKSHLTANGEEISPSSLAYTVKSDANNIISSISENGAIAFTGNLGIATVTVNFAYTPGSKSVEIGDDGTVTGSADITVTVNEYIPHNWSTTPVWVWTEDYSSATAKFGCLDPGCEEEFVAEATVEATENTPTCQEAKVTTYTATAIGPDGQTYTSAKESGGTHEVYVYKKVTALSSGKDYVIVNTDQAGSNAGTILTNSSGALGTATVTIYAPSEDDDIDANYISADDVPVGAVWSTGALTTITISNTSYSGYKVSNGEYILQITGQNNTLAATESETYSDSVWSYSGTALKYDYAGNGGSHRERWVSYSGGAFAGATSSSTVYIFEKTTIVEGEMGPHDFHFTQMYWGEGHASAVAEFECSVCNTTKEVHATVTSEDKEADCALPSRTEYTATATGPDGETYTDTVYTEREILEPYVDTDATVFKLVNSISASKQYLIVTRNSAGEAHALSYWPEGSSTAVTDDAVTVIENTIDGSPATYIEYRDIDDPQSIWTAVSNNSYWRLRSNTGSNRWLYTGSSSTLEVTGSNTNWTYSNNSLYRESSSGNKYYVTYGTTWGVVRNTESNVYLYELVTGVTINTTRGEVAPALGHDFTNQQHTAAADPTCETAGNVEYWTCDR